jgi:hypothetical protein
MVWLAAMALVPAGALAAAGARSPVRPTPAAAPPKAGAAVPYGHPDFYPTPERPIGSRGDGSGVFPGARPVTDWDEKTGRNVLWKTLMPNWGHGCPIVVGERVFLTAEPGWKSDWPALLCVNARDGRILWERPINHLAVAVADAAGREAIARTWRDLMARYRLAYNLFNLYFYSDDKEGGIRKFADHGFTYGGWSGGGYGQLRKMRFADAEAHKADLKTIARAGLDLETWQHECGMGTSCVGQIFATPASDGQSVYVATAFGSFAGFDLDGNLRWMQFVRGEASQGGNDYCKNARSPLLYRDLFISDIANVVRAFDRRTGQVRWAHEIFGTHTIMSPVVLTVGGTDVLLCVGPHAYRLPDGKPLPVEGWSSAGARAVLNTDHRDTVFFTGGGEHGGWEGKGDCPTPPPAAVRFALQGERLTAKVLWCGAGGERLCEHTALTYHDGQLYHGRGLILDAATGKVLAGSTDRRGNRAVPQTRQFVLIAGDRVYGLHEGRGSETQPAQTGVCEVYTLDGRKVAESTLSNAPPEGEKKEQIVATHGYNTWRFTYACPFTVAGERLYVRSNDYLFCLGPK